MVEAYTSQSVGVQYGCLGRDTKVTINIFTQVLPSFHLSWQTQEELSVSVSSVHDSVEWSEGNYLKTSTLMYLPLGWYLLSATQWQLLSDWVAQFGFWCLPHWIQFGFSITSCYPRKPQGPIGHWRPPHESLYFLQTRLRGRGGHSPNSTQTLQTMGGEWVGEKGGERSHGASPPALSPINQTFPLRLCCSLMWLPQSSLFSLQLLTDEHNSAACYLSP